MAPRSNTTARRVTTVNSNQVAINNQQGVLNAHQAVFNDEQRRINAAQARTNAQVQQQLDDDRKIASGGVATAVAVASMPALDLGKKIGLGVGVGSYDGRSGVAVGLAARVSEALQFKLNAGTSSEGRAAAGAGGMVAW